MSSSHGGYNFSARTGFEAELRENVIQRAYLGKAALKQVQANKGGKSQEIIADEQRAGFHAQRQGQQYKSTSDNTDNTFCIHD
jgi:hypothetical protein